MMIQEIDLISSQKKKDVFQTSEIWLVEDELITLFQVNLALHFHTD